MKIVYKYEYHLMIFFHFFFSLLQLKGKGTINHEKSSWDYSKWYTYGTFFDSLFVNHPISSIFHSTFSHDNSLMIFQMILMPKKAFFEFDSESIINIYSIYFSLFNVENLKFHENFIPKLISIWIWKFLKCFDNLNQFSRVNWISFGNLFGFFVEEKINRRMHFSISWTFLAYSIFKLLKFFNLSFLAIFLFPLSRF